MARKADAEWVRDGLEWVDPDDQVAHTAEGARLEYDALLLAVGAARRCPVRACDGVRRRAADDTYRGVVQDIEEGYTHSLALLLPDGPAWPLPVYELALMTAQRAESMWMDELGVDIVTADPEPLAAFGHGASNAVAELLEAAGVRVHTSSRAEVPESRKLSCNPRDASSTRAGSSRCRPTGPGIRNVPADHDGFIPIDEHCRVRGLEPRVFAAGDAANLQIKHGGLGAQMADTAAAGSLRCAGAEVQVEPSRPVLRRCALHRCRAAVPHGADRGRACGVRGLPRASLARRREDRCGGARPLPPLARLRRI